MPFLVWQQVSIDLLYALAAALLVHHVLKLVAGMATALFRTLLKQLAKELAAELRSQNASAAKPVRARRRATAKERG